jgi:tetratricopeptide (TPR) repeat protein
MVFFFAAAAGQTETVPLSLPTTQDPVDRALHRLFNADFAAAQAIITEEISKNPENPLLYSLRGGALFFSELNRMNILELEFFADNESITDRKRLKPDPTIRHDFFEATGKARSLASARLATVPQDANATFALLMAVGAETDYTLLVEKKYIRSYSLTKETQRNARKALQLTPPLYDAYLSLGMLEYVVGNLNFFYRMFVHFDQIEGSKQKAIGYLKLVIDHGRYYSPYAKLLLSVIYLRDKMPEKALDLLQDLQRDFPDNPLVRKEVLRLSGRLGPKLNKSGR